MVRRHRVLGSLLVCCAIAAAILPPATAQESLCPAPALSRLTRHRIAAGETLAAIAQRYSLIPATLIGFNPALRNGLPPVGTEIVIPPYNGIRVEVPAGQTWRDVAARYGVRADVLFEVNGCQRQPRVVFIPGVNWSPTGTTTATQPTGGVLTGYPLPSEATILQAYGWQVSPTTGQVVFNSGVELAAQPGTPVLATGSGTIAFAGAQNGTNLIVINHAQGLQTRYALLGSIGVRVGQTVRAGDRIGTSATSLHFEVRSNSSLGWVAQNPSTYIRNLNLRTQ
ncbi:M23 family metallopeptidase [Microcoleus sp. FACHB-1515]|uniref:LysM peptidoglycan-binding domain-containing M23 family metallopeptidase n=1 Tax=Cyanophyceae TaxID=3028117 RepID=UPI001682F46B|nr:M23 family metallopeptidase [Microcoleus sp. FACHB-1515]MBD2091887.1 M23 family metallopeptidase [Microcoleus sp. FACHB-1515]